MGMSIELFKILNTLVSVPVQNLPKFLPLILVTFSSVSFDTKITLKSSMLIPNNSFKGINTENFKSRYPFSNSQKTHSKKNGHEVKIYIGSYKKDSKYSKKVLNVLKKHKWYKILLYLFIVNSQKPPASYMTPSAPRRAFMRRVCNNWTSSRRFFALSKKKLHLIMEKHDFTLTG